MSTTRDFQAAPLTTAGVSLASGSSAWAYSSYDQILAASNSTKYITRLTFMPNVTTTSLAVDTTGEVLIELYKGDSDELIAQVPYNYRIDTRVAHILPSCINFTEPIQVESGARIRVRVTDSVAAAMTHNAIKITYYEVPGDPLPPPVGYFPTAHLLQMI